MCTCISPPPITYVHVLPRPITITILFSAQQLMSLTPPSSLKPGQKYYYVFGDSFGRSEEYSFTAPPVVSPDSNVRVVVYGGEWVQWLRVLLYS